MSEQQTFGYVNVWARNTLKGLLDEYEFDNGVLVSGTVSITKEQATSLISYLQNADFGEYGTKLDIAIFHNPDKNVILSGSIKTPYVKEEGKTSKTTNAKRKMV